MSFAAYWTFNIKFSLSAPNQCVDLEALFDPPFKWRRRRAGGDPTLWQVGALSSHLGTRQGVQWFGRSSRLQVLFSRVAAKKQKNTKQNLEGVQRINRINTRGMQQINE